MKKRTKRAVIAAAALIVIGVALVAAGVIAAGGRAVLKEQGAIQNLVQGTVMESVIVEMENVENGTAQRVTNTCVAEKVDCLVMDLEAVSVDVQESGSTDWFEIETDEFYDVYEEDRTLYIVPKDQGLKNSDLKNRKISVKIPTGFTFEKLEIIADASEVNIQRLRTEDLEVTVDAGNVVIEELLAETADIEISAGAMQVNQGEVISLEADTDTGNLKYTGKINQDAEIECDLGNVEIYLEDQVSAYDYTIECDNGKVMIGGQTFSGLESEKRIDNHSEKEFHIECSNGNVEIYLKR